MDLPLSPEPSTVQIVAMLIGTLLSAVLLAGIGYLIWKSVRSGRLTLRRQETLDAHAIRSGYTQGIRDAGWQQRQHLDFQLAQARLDQFTATLNQAGARLEDTLRRLNHAATHPVPGSSEATTGPILIASPYKPGVPSGNGQRPGPHRPARPSTAARPGRS